MDSGKFFMARNQFVKWLLGIVAALALFAIMAPVITLAFLRWEHRTTIELPRPTGPYAIGRTSYMGLNTSATDELAPSAGASRELVVWIWYAASCGEHSFH
jgi:hypothetical protein